MQGYVRAGLPVPVRQQQPQLQLHGLLTFTVTYGFCVSFSAVSCCVIAALIVDTALEPRHERGRQAHTVHRRKPRSALP